MERERERERVEAYRERVICEKPRMWLVIRGIGDLSGGEITLVIMVLLVWTCKRNVHSCQNIQSISFAT